MYCKKCGNQIPDDANNCPHCGTAVNEVVDEKPVKKKKKGKNKTAKIIGIVLAILLIPILLVVFLDDGESSDAGDSSKETTTKKKAYSIGENVVIKTDNGDYSLKITGVHETDARNEFADEKPKHVAIIDYEYENLSFDGDVVVSFVYLRAYDHDGNALTMYPDISVKQSTNISQGKKATASVAYGLDSDEKEMTLDFYDISMETYGKPKCSFNLTW